MSRWRTALVTGASSGIGREIARQAAARGADVVAVARREDELRTLAREVRDTWGRTVEVLPADLLTAGGLAAVEARLADPDRPVDLLVNNAGFGSLGWFHELPIDREDRQIRLNVLAVTRLASAALAAMVPAAGAACSTCRRCPASSRCRPTRSTARPRRSSRP